MKEDNENPEYNEELVFDIKDEEQKIKLIIMDSNTFSDDEYAHVEVDLAKILGDSETISANDVKLQDAAGKEKQGTLSYTVEVVTIKTLKIHLNNARKLASGWSDTIDPFIKVTYNG